MRQPQTRRASPLVYLAAIGLPTALALLAGLQPWVAPETLFKDPLYLAHGEPHFGLLSNLGILAWSGAAAICLFAACQLGRSGAEGEQRRFLHWAGAITTLLVLDDLFLLHEFGYPSLLGVHETTAFAGYGLLVAAFVFRFRTLLRRQDPALLVLALAMFAASILFDKLTGPRTAGIVAATPALHFLQPLIAAISPWAALLDDGPKLVGIFGWAGFLIHTAGHALRAPEPAPAWPAFTAEPRSVPGGLPGAAPAQRS